MLQEHPSETSSWIKSNFARTPNTIFFTNGGTPRPRIPLRQNSRENEIERTIFVYNWKLIEKDNLPVVNIERYHGQACGKRDETDGHAVIQPLMESEKL